MGYPRKKVEPKKPIDIKRVVSELTCRYCGRGASSIAELRGHIGQCKKRRAFLEKIDSGIIVVVHGTYFFIKPKAISVLKHIRTLRGKYQERNNQPEIWGQDIQKFTGALTAWWMEQKLTFEIISREEAIQLSHSVAEVLRDTKEVELKIDVLETPKIVEEQSEPLAEPKEYKTVLEKIQGKKKKKIIEREVE